MPYGNSNQNSNSININNFFYIEEDIEDDPRKTTFLQFINKNIFRCYKLLSFTSIISLMEIIMFTVTILFGIKKDSTVLLAPLDSTLDTFGMKDPYKQQKGQVWRFITFAFLHANFIHIFSNMISQLIIISKVEAIIGFFKTLLFYMLTS